MLILRRGEAGDEATVDLTVRGVTADGIAGDVATLVFVSPGGRSVVTVQQKNLRKALGSLKERPRYGAFSLDHLMAAIKKNWEEARA